MSAVPPRLDGVKKIAVLRPNAVGDFVFALPALHALKHAYPEAELVLLGKVWHAEFLQGRPGPVDRVVAMPAVPGVGAPAGAPVDGAAVEAFIARMRDERFDIVAQMYGGGASSNPFARRLGGRLSIGARADGAAPLDCWVPHVEPANRRLALLEIAALAGATLPWLPQELAVTPADRAAAAQVLPPHSGRPLVLLQPGSSDRRRCWPAERFAAVGDALSANGALVAVNGTADEAGLVRRVVTGMRHPSLDLAGRLALGGLCGVLERAALVVSNDTGPLHLALAIGRPAVGIFWHTNLVDGAPLRPGLLRAAVSAQVRCRVCDADNRAARCAHDESFVDEVTVDAVLGHALSQLRAWRSGNGGPLQAGRGAGVAPGCDR